MVRMSLYGYTRPGQIYLWALTVCIVLRVDLGKAEAAYCRPQSGTDFETMAPHVAAVVYFTEYFVRVISAYISR